MKVSGRMIVEAAARLAKESVEVMRPGLEMSAQRVEKMTGAAMAEKFRNEQIETRTELVTDSYLTGAAEAIKMLAGDFEHEPWVEDTRGTYHEKRLDELLQKYRALNGSEQLNFGAQK